MITLRGKLQRSIVPHRRPKDESVDEQSATLSPASTGTSTKRRENEEEVDMVEEWTWQGVWAFGNLPNNQEEIDKLLLNPPLQPQNADAHADEAAQSKKNAAVWNTSTPTRAVSNCNQSSPNWIQKLSSIITGGGSKSEEATVAAPSTTSPQQQGLLVPATATKKRGRGRPPKSSYSPAEAAAIAAKEIQRKLDEERERLKPRPFIYKWIEIVKAEDICVPSSLIVIGADDDNHDYDDEDGKEEQADNDGDEKKEQKQQQMKATSAPKGIGSDDDEVMKDVVVEEGGEEKDVSTTTVDVTTKNINNDTDKDKSKNEKKKANKKKKPNGITYAEPPYTDATKTHPPNTCPSSGKWEGHFENVTLKMKSRQNNRIKEVFYLFFNGTPSKDAHFDAFVDGDLTLKANAMLDDKSNTDVSSTGSGGEDDNDNDNKNDDEKEEEKKKHLLKEGCIHVRGHGSNRFGTFEIVGSFDPSTEVLQCQRMYVPLIDEDDDLLGSSTNKKRGRRSRSEATRLLAESADLGGGGGGGGDDVGRGSVGGRKRKTSWKTRSKDMSTFGDDTIPVVHHKRGGSNTDIASIVKKRSRLSGESSGNKSPGVVIGGGGSGTMSLPQCRGGVDGSLKINMSVLKNPPTYKPSPSPASTTGTGSGKKMKGGKNKKASPSFQGPFPGTVVPVAPIPILPSEGDPFLARWRAAHYLYYQRIEHNPDDDGQPTWGSTINPSQGTHTVTVKSVVYEGEMHDGVREGRGLCLYNNNLMYEGEWKRNKEHGKGTLMSPDRSRIIYEGDWEKGRMHGRGSYYYYDALNNEKETSKYVGEFKENLRHGRGVYTLPDGSIYDGEWRENNPNGWGLFRWPDGSEYQGPWKDGKRNGTNGILIAADGFRYEGSWANNAMEGIGVATYPNGQTYEGKFVGGRREGRGTIRFTNGAIYEGRFKDDYMEGQGTMKMSENVIIAKRIIKEDNDDTNDMEVVAKNDWMIPLQFQSDISHIHQKAGFTQVGL